MTALRSLRTSLIASALLLATAGAGLAQGMSVGFEGLRQNTSAPVEVTADELTVNRAAGGATFAGNVLVVQGEMRLSAGKVDVEYAADGQGIRRLVASGGVTLATPSDAAEAQQATYEVGSGALVMSGAVLLTQGPSTISGERLTADLRAGTGRMEGRVKTLFKPGAQGGN